MQQIVHLNIEVTRHCNQRCFYCFNDSGPFRSADGLSPATWLRVIRALASSELQSVHVTGGEPFLWTGTVELLEGIQAIGLSTSVLSNGARVPKLVKSNPSVISGLSVAQISLDAMTPSLHDKRRGVPGAWQQAIDAIRSLVSLRVPVEVSATVSDANVQEIPAIAEFCKSVGARLLIRQLVLAGRAAHAVGKAAHRSNQIAQCLPNLELKYPDTLVTDRFRYVPDHPRFYAKALETGFATVEADGRLRCGPIHVAGKSSVTNALELLAV